MTFFTAFAKTRITTLFALFCTALLLSMSACEEIPPTLNLTSDSSGPTSNALEDQLSGVLVEEFTGVKCVNCPAGAEAIALLKDIHQERLVPISIHAGFFSRPYPESTIDFRTADADAIETFVGGPQGYPSSVIDRTQFQGEASLQLSQSTWAGYVGQQLQREPAVAIGLELDYVSDARSITINTELLGRTGTGGRNAFITVLLLENKVIDVQLTPEGKDPNYSHEHVLRMAVTSPTGDQLGAIAAGQTIENEYTVPVSADYKAEDIEIVAFVHYADADEGGKEVLQAVSEKL